MPNHTFAASVVWEGNLGVGTARHESYERRFRASVVGKPDLWGSAAPAFRGDPTLHNPEDLLVVALSSCHLLTYLALCARAGVRVFGYRDLAEATLAPRADAPQRSRFREARLCPTVTVAERSQLELARTLHARAAEQCFIAGSCDFPVRHAPVVEVAR